MEVILIAIGLGRNKRIGAILGIHIIVALASKHNAVERKNKRSVC